MSSKFSKPRTRKVLIVADLSRYSRRDFLSGLFNAADSGFDWSIQLIQSEDALTPMAARSILASGIDGAIILENWNSEALSTLESSRISIVAVGARTDWFSKREDGITFLRINDERVGTFAAEYFMHLGKYNSYIYLSADREALWDRERGKGFCEAVIRDGSKPVILRSSDTESFADLMKRTSKPVAVFAACDRIAATALATLKSPEQSVPRQISILGADDDRIICQTSRPHLSSIRPGHYDEGIMAAHELNALMNARIPRSRKQLFCSKMELVERASTAFVAPVARLLSAAGEFIEQNAVRDIAPDDVARHLGVSRRLLDLRFHEFSETTVAGAIRAARLKILKRELMESKDRLSAIGRRCGFANANYLKKIFHAETGLTLGEWRQRHGKSGTICRKR